MSKLALYGGEPLIKYRFNKYNSIGLEEEKAVSNVMKSRVLSGFVANTGDGFYGGPKVQEFEKYCKDYFNVKHAITLNSWTSGLVAALGAIGLEPGDEVIVSPWTMSASATAILHWCAIPIFADIEPDTFCIDPVSVESNISEKTKAILAVDIFGQSSDVLELTKICKKYNLKLIFDSAQSPNAKYKNKFVGTMGDIGGYSLNYHKHIHTGEGGIIVTNNDEYAENIRLIRNHGEAVVDGFQKKNIANIIGHNFRMGEIEASIGIEQLKKLNSKTESRKYIAKKLDEGLKSIRGLKTPKVRESCDHVYYVYAMLIDESITGVSKYIISDALKAEGLTSIGTSYCNLHLLPMYQQKIAYGKNGFPWSSENARKNISYQYGICPISEKMNEKSYLDFGICHYELNDYDIENIIKSFKKVWDNLDEIKKNENLK